MDGSVSWFDIYELLESSGVSYICIEDTGKVWPLQDAKCAILTASRDIYAAIYDIHTSVLLNVSAACQCSSTNEPKLAGTAIELPTLVELCRGGGVVGVKDSGGSGAVTNALVAAATGVPVFQGWEHLCLETPGVQGYILPLSNLEAALCREMFESPSPERKEEMLRHCAAHDLLGDRWYAGLKRELERRGIIASARLV